MSLFESVMKKNLASFMSGKATNADAMAILEKAQFPNYMAAELQQLIADGVVTEDTAMEVQRTAIGRSFKAKQEAGKLRWPLYDWFVEFFGPVPDEEGEASDSDDSRGEN